MASPRTIVHLDADAFFASVEQAADPRLRGKAMAVGGAKRGIIASASYEARKFGVYTPMPSVKAKKLCSLILVPGDFEKYEQFSKWMFSYVHEFTPEVEPTGIDEGYFDLSGVKQPPAEVAAAIQKSIHQSLKITVSMGIASNKLISQIASKLNKPRALLEVPAGQEQTFLNPLPNKWLPGMGPKTSARLDAAGLFHIKDIAEAPVDLLEGLVGNYADELRRYAQGMDERPVDTGETAAKSYSEQETFVTDLTDEDYLEAVLRRMADSLMRKVRAAGSCIRTLTVRVRYRHMDEDQRSESLHEPTDLETDIYGRLRPLLLRAWKRRREGLRLVSLKLSNVYENWYREELPLFVDVASSTSQRTLARVVDDLRKSYGRNAIMRGHDLLLREETED